MVRDDGEECGHETWVVWVGMSCLRVGLVDVVVGGGGG